MSQPPDRSAQDLLLRCLSAGREPLAVGIEPVDWTAVVALADSHTLTPLLYSRLKESGAQPLVPADVWERLRQTYVASAVRSMCFYRDLRPVLRRLRSSGINVIALKGAYLAEAVYRDAALRPMVDVDLMVPKADLPRAHAVLLGLRRAQQPMSDAERHGSGSGSPGLAIGAGIDLRWTIDVPGGRSRLDTAGLWDRARPATVAGVGVLAFSPEDLVLHVCLHAAHRHGLNDGLRPVCDVTETVKRFRDTMEWNQVAERAREWGAARYVGLTLLLARGMLGAEVPDAVLEQLVPGGIEPDIFNAARESVLARTGYLQRMPFFGRLGARSFADVLKLSLERVFLSRAEMAARYPPARDSRLLLFFYALRLGDVVRAYCSHAFRRRRLMAQGHGYDPNASLVDWLRSG